jgi:hypothetical protein
MIIASLGGADVRLLALHHTHLEAFPANRALNLNIIDLHKLAGNGADGVLKLRVQMRQQHGNVIVYKGGEAPLWVS